MYVVIWLKVILTSSKSLQKRFIICVCSIPFLWRNTGRDLRVCHKLDQGWVVQVQCLCLKMHNSCLSVYCLRLINTSWPWNLVICAISKSLEEKCFIHYFPIELYFLSEGIGCELAHITSSVYWSTSHQIKTSLKNINITFKVSKTHSMFMSVFLYLSQLNSQPQMTDISCIVY